MALAQIASGGMDRAEERMRGARQMAMLILLGASLGFWSLRALSQEPGGYGDAPPAPQTNPAAGKGKPQTEGAEVLRAPLEDPPEPKTYTKAQVQKYCSKYEGRLVAFYDEIYRIERCKRRAMLHHNTVYDLQRKGQKVIDVNADVIAAIPEGDPIETGAKGQVRTCKQLQGAYVAYSSSEVYFVEKCRKRIFPDWSTYTKHREQNGARKGMKHAAQAGEILILSWAEFDGLEEGEPMPSMLDDMYRKMLSTADEPDIIPVDEACKGLEGKTATYYSRVYRIERCKKREYKDSEGFFRLHGRERLKLVEMQPDQWLSLPDGKPMEQSTGKVRKETKALSEYAPE